MAIGAHVAGVAELGAAPHPVQVVSARVRGRRARRSGKKRRGARMGSGVTTVRVVVGTMVAGARKQGARRVALSLWM